MKFACLQNYLLRFEKETGKKVNILRTDNGLEFVNKQIQNLTFKEGIEHQRTVQYCPEQNGKAEREIRTLAEASRTMLIAKRLPKYLWAEAVNTTTYVLNRSRKVKNSRKVPYEIWFNTTNKCNISHLRVFGSKVVVQVPDELRQKLDPKGKTGIIVGYSEESKAYKVLLDGARKISKQINVEIKEELTSDVSQDNQKEIDEDYCIFQCILRPENAEAIQQNVPERENVVIQENIQEKALDNNIQPDVAELPRENNYDEIPEDFADIFEEQEIFDIIDENLENQNNQNINQEINNQNPDNRYNLRNRQQIQQPHWLDDYAYVHELLLCQTEPANFKQAVESDEADKWKAAMKEEIDALNKNKTWVLVEAPKNTTILNNRWVYKIKTGADGSSKRYKARLVVKVTCKNLA